MPERGTDAALRELVELCWRDSHIYGARPATASKTLTVGGRRRLRGRLQSDICRAMLTPQDAHPYYPDLWPAILERVEELRAAARG